ncbi:MAG: hypothetical protein Q8P61_03070 [Candidatus Nanopelagicales bacterium]|nr:hypothetical protein [Candidatus Nanopelagicales bacterium]
MSNLQKAIGRQHFGGYGAPNELRKIKLNRAIAVVPLCMLALVGCGDSQPAPIPTSTSRYFQEFLTNQGSTTAADVNAARTWTCAQYVQAASSDRQEPVLAMGSVWLDNHPNEQSEHLSPDRLVIDRATYVGQMLWSYCSGYTDVVEPDRASDVVIGVQPDLG